MADEAEDVEHLKSHIVELETQIYDLNHDLSMCRKERDLAASVENLTDLLPVATLVISKTGRILQSNRQFEIMTGYPHDDGPAHINLLFANTEQPEILSRLAKFANARIFVQTELLARNGDVLPIGIVIAHIGTDRIVLCISELTVIGMLP